MRDVDIELRPYSASTLNIRMRYHVQPLQSDIDSLAASSSTFRADLLAEAQSSPQQPFLGRLASLTLHTFASHHLYVNTPLHSIIAAHHRLLELRILLTLYLQGFANDRRNPVNDAQQSRASDSGHTTLHLPSTEDFEAPRGLQYRTRIPMMARPP